MKTVITTVLILFSIGILAEVVRYPLPNNSTFPISQAVEVKAGTTLVFHSGTVPGAADSKAERFSREFWGDTKTCAPEHRNGGSNCVSDSDFTSNR